MIEVTVGVIKFRKSIQNLIASAVKKRQMASIFDTNKIAYNDLGVSELTHKEDMLFLRKSYEETHVMNVNVHSIECKSYDHAGHSI